MYRTGIRIATKKYMWTRLTPDYIEVIRDHEINIVLTQWHVCMINF